MEWAGRLRFPCPVQASSAAPARSVIMVRNGSLPPAGRRGRRFLAPLLLGALCGGCAAMERMDYLDRIFEPERFARPVPAAQPAPGGALPSEPDAETVVAMEPLPDPVPLPASQRTAPSPPAREAVPATLPAGPDDATRLRATLRRNPWLTRFWSELTAAQQGRVEQRLRRGETPAAEAAGAWDSMGLADRARLVFGDRPDPGGPGPGAPRGGANWASRP